ncbi:tyrocidine non-ribosomal peptide synthetase TycA [Brevibacillus porteri]|uniref:Tyrocidine non-ribosomal peptide synthetase TycA n=1 Tax=Brevibacillus porteri TaxID=2126350 RepID=A0ABX5FUT3_9BACL|nr:tyrocidine non-ribosomal peptide synthetase TycA [Brevibacillus porteri]MED1799206.1 tyrocidine non-ribosomal peptide synthetase TycA [Brevibacillus porteri]MED2132406.1 tyrocidine non-ribosomal peptide synthetase TycA [Brevibacillus porteri]MED2744489.1 tyrocidine non-ribosomal peptide synthetase TycA [Brevibacillus porteri]MED2814933.1 tyrocidine non-ribosomal peptide synthetase TycA [Brevibacillus porteri]MED2895621.1 tyrocidine non-ribosomal peptide synthetase TycA [Brevibacillus porter
MLGNHTNLIDLEREKEQVALFNDTKAEYPQDKSIHQLFEEQAEAVPHRVAIVYENERLTYQELNRKANQLARALIEKGIKTDSIVGVMMEKSIENVIAILAILKAGGAYVPIDIEYPRDRIQYILQDSQTKIVITQKNVSNLVYDVGYRGPVVVIEEEQLDSRSDSNLHLPSKPTDMAYVIYTSGTTGKPKGTMLEHKGIANLQSFFQNTFGVTPADRIGQFASMSFDASVWEMFMALLTGASLYILSKQTIHDFISFENYLNKNELTIITLPPTYLTHLNPDHFTSLRIMITAGSAANFPLVNRWKNKVRYVNAYGPTETSICATIWEAPSNVLLNQTIPIGKPIQNTYAYIVNEELQLQPIGSEGELCIGGVGLARGYWNRPDLTAEKFVDNPFVPGEKMYRTGDLAKWLPNGEIEFLGRIDHQVKIRGHRIELGEIESVLLKHEQIKEAVVIAREDQHDQPYLCAYYISQLEVTPAQIREFAAQKLPAYMLPSYFVKLDKMPLTPNDKIDRKALPEPDVTAETNPAYEPPRNQTESILATVWQEVLGIEKIGIRDNFYSLGGDSIQAIQVAARLHAYQLKLDTKDLLNYPTISQVALYVKSTTRRSEQGIIEGPVTLTPIQQWFFEKNFTNMFHWNQSYVLYREQGFEPEAIRKALDKILSHHDALRMVYRNENGRIIQQNRGLGSKLYDFLQYDLTSHSDVQQAIEEETKRLHSSMNLEEGQLVKAALFHTLQGDHLFLAIHHLVVDGISWRILFEDLATAYSQVLAGKEIVLPEKTDSFKNWAVWLNEYANSDELVREIPYWENLESEARHASLPKDYETKGCKQKSIRNIQIGLLAEETEQLLKQANSAYQTEINDLLLAALGLAVAEWSKLDQIVINLEGHGREDVIEHANVTRTIGWFTSQYPVLLDLSQMNHLPEHIKCTKENLRKIPNKGIGYEILKYMTEPEKRRSLSYSLYPEVTFNYLGQFDSGLNNELFTRSPYSSGNSLGADGKNNLSPDSEIYTALNITGRMEGGELLITFTYSEEQFREESIHQLSENYRKHLRAIITHCSQKKEVERTPSDFSMKGLQMEEMDDIFELLANTLN